MIQVYANILPKDFCENLIHKFDALQNKDTTHSMFDQAEMFPRSEWKEETDALINTVKRVAEHYYKIHDLYNMMPQKNRIEGFRIKRYEPNKHSFPLHVDVTNAETCTRYLGFLFYLNDNDAGTKFYGPDGTDPLTIEAKQSNMLVFPPMWMFAHEGIMPTKSPKYIMSTYFHYV